MGLVSSDEGVDDPKADFLIEFDEDVRELGKGGIVSSGCIAVPGTPCFDPWWEVT